MITDNITGPTGSDWLILIGIVITLPFAMFVLGCVCVANIVTNPKPQD